MALIGKIREKSWLILVLVGGALIAFVLGDWQKMGGGMESKYGLGTVYGEKVDFEAYQTAYNIADENNRRNAAQQNQQAQPLDEYAVWNSFVQDLLLKKEYEALGIAVSDAEFDAFIFGTDGFDVMPDLAQSFIDSVTGLFNANLLRARIDEMKTSSDENVQKQWEETEKYYLEKRKREKYMALLNQGVYTTKLEAKDEYLAQKEIKSVSFVLKRYSDVADKDIDLSEAKIKAYFEENKHLKKYENRFSSRDVKFIDITLDPSRDDSLAFEKNLTKLREEFSKTSNDSLFVLKNSEMRFFTTQVGYRAEGNARAREGFTYPLYLDSTFKAAKVGDIVGPYLQNGTTMLAKVVGKKDKLLSVRHILISANKEDAAAVKKAKKTTDSLLTVVNATNFEEMVRKHSQDPGSAQTGGKYEDFVDGEMVPEFSKFAMEEPIGKIGYVQTDYGFHIMEVLDRKEGGVPNLALVARTLKPSDATNEAIEKDVYDLLYQLDAKLAKTSDPVKKIELFDTLVSRKNHFARPVNIMDNSPRLNGFASKLAEDKILELAFREEAKVGDLVSAPIKDNNRFIIAILSSIRVKGETNYEDVKLIVKNDYIVDQKAKRFIAQMSKAKRLEDVTKDGKSLIQNAEVTFANPQITGGGFEPEVVGALYSGLKDGQLAKPIKGKQGVYLVKIDKTVKAPTTSNYDVEMNQLTAAARSKIGNDATRALVEKAEVVDNRRFYNMGLRY